MKRILSFGLGILFSGILLLNCTPSVEKKLAGTWKVEDVKFDSQRPMDPAQAESAKKSAQEVSYELMKDFNAKIVVGSTVLEGRWTYKKAEEGVYMVFKNSTDTVLIGRYEEGKLINIATRPDLKITTIFYKTK
jgi:hypothetical protein